MPNFEDMDEARSLLGLGETATLKDIRSAYRRLAHQHHPDKHGSADEGNNEMMKKLNRAYKLLLDYCIDYRYSFREEEVARPYPYEEHMRKWCENWFNNI